MDSVIDNMWNSNELSSSILHDNPLYLILVNAIRGIAVIMKDVLENFCYTKI